MTPNPPVRPKREYSKGSSRKQAIEDRGPAPDQQLTALCGHTHGDGETQVLPNLLAITGGATYGRPVVQRVFDVE